MSYLDKLDPDGTKRKEGKFVEGLLKEWLTKTGCEVLPYDRMKDIREHKDVQFITPSGELLSCDVKSPKRLKHNDEEYMMKETFLEYTGPTGYPGWLYGKEDFVAFLLPDYQTFYFANLKELQSLWNSKNIVNRTYMVETAKASLGNWYRRKNTLEKTSIFTYDEIRALPHTQVIKL